MGVLMLLNVCFIRVICIVLFYRAVHDDLEIKLTTIQLCVLSLRWLLQPICNEPATSSIVINILKFSQPNRETYSYAQFCFALVCFGYSDVIMTTMASQITSRTVVYSIVNSGAAQRKHQSSASPAFVREFTGTGEFPAQRASNA